MISIFSFSPRAISAVHWARRGIPRKLLPLMILFVLFSMQYSAIEAQSGWHHCDIQDHSYTGPGTRYFCRPVSYDWLCNIARITSFCNNSAARGDNSDGGSGVSVRTQSGSGPVSSMHVQRVSAAGIGAQWIIDAGFIAAIDVWGKDVAGEFCLDGVGSLLFLDASTSPRVQSWLDSVQRDGQTCATLDRPGMLVLMPAGAQYQHCRVRTTGHLKLRAEPSLDAEIIGYVPTGESPAVLSRDGHWFHVEYQGKTGWIGASYVNVDCGGTEASTPAQAPAGGVATLAASPSQQCGIITAGHLKLRASPSLDGEIIGYVPTGESPRLLSWSGDWVNVEYQGKTGWIGAAYVSEDSDCGGTVAPASSVPQLRDCGITTTGILRVRAGPSLDDDTIGFVQRGVRLRSISRSGDWVNVEYQGKSGWIGAAYASEDGDCG